MYVYGTYMHSALSFTSPKLYWFSQSVYSVPILLASRFLVRVKKARSAVYVRSWYTRLRVQVLQTGLVKDLSYYVHTLKLLRHVVVTAPPSVLMLGVPPAHCTAPEKSNGPVEYFSRMPKTSLGSLP